MCVNCGDTGHSDDCPGPVKCYHYGGAHQASSRECDRYKFEKEVLLIRTQERISFSEAKKRAMTRHVRPGVTYASIAGDILRRPALFMRSQMPVKPVLPAELVQPMASMDAYDGTQKGSRSEDSPERGPPTKIQAPQPSRELVGASKVTVIAATTCPQTRVAQRPESSGDKDARVLSASACTLALT